MNLVLSLVLFAADPLPSPWDFEAQVKSSPTIIAIQKDLAEVKLRVAACPCSNQMATAPLTAVPASTPMVQVCGPNGCQMVPASSAQTFAAPMFSEGGSCANGSCGGGQSQGRRGLFGRRR